VRNQSGRRKPTTARRRVDDAPACCALSTPETWRSATRPPSNASRSSSPAERSSGASCAISIRRSANESPVTWTGRLRSAVLISSASDQLPSERARAKAGVNLTAPSASPSSDTACASAGTGKKFARAKFRSAAATSFASAASPASARVRATRTTQQRRPPFAKKARTVGARCAPTCSPRSESHASAASRPKTDSKCAADSTATGTSNGPDAAKPTKQATSMRGRRSSSGGDSCSNRKPGRRLVTTRFMTGSC
jgi:hypothetical protein